MRIAGFLDTLSFFITLSSDYSNIFIGGRIYATVPGNFKWHVMQYDTSLTYVTGIRSSVYIYNWDY